LRSPRTHGDKSQEIREVRVLSHRQLSESSDEADHDEAPATRGGDALDSRLSLLGSLVDSHGGQRWSLARGEGVL
jgi:hypothetical protein